MNIKSYFNLKQNTSLWTKEFKKFVAGIFGEYLSNAGMAFVLSILVLDVTDSVLWYGTYLVLYYVSSIFVPLFIGPVIEHRNKTFVNCLCCIVPAILYGTYYVLYTNQACNLVVTFAVAIISGMIHAIFVVGANAQMLEIVEKENLQKAYSIYNAIETFSEITVPIATIVYKSFGLNNILLACVVLFIIATVVISKIKTTGMPQLNTSKKSYFADLVDGVAFVKKERGYLYITLAFFLNFAISGIRRTTWMPYYQSGSENSYLWYFVIMASMSTGLFYASVFLYILKIKKEHRFLIATVSFIVSGVLSSLILVTPIAVSIILAFAVGLGFGIFSNLCSVSIFAELDEDRRSRYSGMFTATQNSGLVIGMICASIVSEKLPLTHINIILSAILIIMFVIEYLVIGKTEVKDMHNR